jgi:hypothetical protein
MITGKCEAGQCGRLHISCDNERAGMNKGYGQRGLRCRNGKKFLAHETPFELQQAQQTALLSILLINNKIERINSATIPKQCCRIPPFVAKPEFCCEMLQDVAVRKASNFFVYSMLHLL